MLHSTSEILLDGKLCEDSSNEDGTKDEVYTLVEGPTRIGIAGFIFGGALIYIIQSFHNHNCKLQPLLYQQSVIYYNIYLIVRDKG